MAFPDFQSVKPTAYAVVEQSPNARRLICLHTVIPAVVSLVLTVMSYLLSKQVEGTGGLGGLGLRSFLESAQSMLQVINMIFTLFWTYGLYRIVSNWSRGQRAWDSDLLAGFHHIGPILRVALLQILLYSGVVILALQLSSILFSMTPLAADITALAQQLLEDPNFMPTEEQILQATRLFMPFLVIVLLVLFLPVFYRLRMAEFVVMDAPEKGALYALRFSSKLMRGNCLKLLKFDLGFWWFYLLEVLAGFLFYGDWILELLGIDLGLSADVLFFIACIMGLIAQTALYIWRKNQIMTAYALVYRQLLPQQEETAT